MTTVPRGYDCSMVVAALHDPADHRAFGYITDLSFGGNALAPDLVGTDPTVAGSPQLNVVMKLTRVTLSAGTVGPLIS
ncbi:hypothetical protein [Streptacidiphilus sp. PAMC 29251]